VAESQDKGVVLSSQKTKVSMVTTRLSKLLPFQLSDVQHRLGFSSAAIIGETLRLHCWVSDGTYRGNRALTRYEFAAGVNACLDRVNELITTATSDLVTRRFSHAY